MRPINPLSWLLILLFAVPGCTSYNMEPIKAEPIYFSTADLEISLTYIPPESLGKLHGINRPYSRVNPYLDFPAYITRKRLIVFKFKASSGISSINFTLENSHLEILGISGNAKSQNYLSKIWEPHTNREGLERMLHTMKKTILPRKFTVEPEKPVEGYLVFGENYPKKGGQALVTFSVRSSDGSSGFLEIPFTFQAEGAENSKENTGIFSDKAE